MPRRLVLVAVLSALGLLSCGPEVEHVTMDAISDSGESGTATLTQQGSDLKVEITLGIGADTGSQPAHIHEGTCPGLGKIRYSLSPIQNGKSVSVVPILKLSDVKGNKFVINVHQSTDATKYVSCGQIP